MLPLTVTLQLEPNRFRSRKCVLARPGLSDVPATDKKSLHAHPKPPDTILPRQTGVCLPTGPRKEAQADIRHPQHAPMPWLLLSAQGTQKGSTVVHGSGWGCRCPPSLGTYVPVHFCG